MIELIDHTYLNHIQVSVKSELVKIIFNLNHHGYI